MEPVRADRLAVVHGARRGSGYLLAARLVLTAGHLVAPDAAATVALPGRTARTECTVVWHGGPEVNAALLLLPHHVVGPEERIPATSLGRLEGLDPLAGCQALGFPRAQQYAGNRLDTEQVVATLKPGSGVVRGECVLDSAHPPPARSADGGSPWRGMAGAPLFSGRHLVGVVTGDPDGWRFGRLAAVPLHRVFDRPDAAEVYRRYVGAPARLTALRPDPDTPDRFERRYRDYVARTYDELTVFGLDFRHADHAQWPLDLAYISLELVRPQDPDDPVDPGDPDDPGAAPASPGHPADLAAARPPGPALGFPTHRSRAERALHGQRRVLLRGLAGSGKTTLVQWLAVRAAQDSFEEFPEARAHLSHLHGRVPFVLPLRSLVRRPELPAPGAFLEAAGHPLRAPDQWAESVLAQGRALLLIDGVDEVPERDRARTQRWLLRLLDAYPENVVVVTTRPTAVRGDWLARGGFTELHLLPMNQRDVTAFVHRWHDAATSLRTDPDARARLEGYRDALLSALPRKPDLARLATNPLMCAMICALHRDRRGFLPDSRMRLYRDALTMLLVRRDREREVATPEGWEVSEEAQLRLLQDLAYWMIKNGLAEADQRQVVTRVARLLPAMPQVARPDQAEDVFRFLLRRSGLLREPAPGTVDFVHRTFLDYLGAWAAVEDQDFRLLARHAHEPQWEDVVRMAVGHARDAERAELLRRLVDLGDQADGHRRARLHLLAAASLEHATSLDPAIRAEVEQRAAALVPPDGLDHARLLVEVGELALDLLPEPKALNNSQAIAVVWLAGQVGGDHALEVLRGFRTAASPNLRRQLAGLWHTFDTETYVTRVLSEMRTDDVGVDVRTGEQLAALPRVGTVRRLGCSGPLSPSALATGARQTAARALSIRNNPHLRDLAALTTLPRLESLTLIECPHLTDYTALSLLRLTKLVLEGAPSDPTLEGLTAHRTLRTLSLDFPGDGPPRPLVLPPDLRSLNVRRGFASLDGVARCRNLGQLLVGRSYPVRELRHLASLTALHSLVCSPATLDELDDPTLPPLPSVRHLTVDTVVHRDTDTAALNRLFPGVRSLHLRLDCPTPARLDVRALADVPEVDLDHVDGPLTVVGAPT